MSILDIRSPDFFDEAACIGADLVLFFPETTNNQGHEAHAICDGCDVRERCLTWAMEIEDAHPGSRHGIYGGLGPKQRAQLGKKGGLMPRGVNQFGVEAQNRLEDLKWMADTGESATGAAARLGIGYSALEVWLRRHDRALWRRLVARDPRDPSFRSNQPPGTYLRKTG